MKLLQPEAGLVAEGDDCNIDVSLPDGRNPLLQIVRTNQVGLGQQEDGTWLVMRCMNICLHSCGLEIGAAQVSNRTIEFYGNHGYLYNVADPFVATNLEWNPAVGAHI